MRKNPSRKQAPASARKGWIVLAVCSLSLFAVGLDTTIVNVALPSIGSGLHVGTRDLEWTVDAYTLVLASLLISSGAIADRVGRRRVFQLGLAVFGTSSVACALAPSVGVLIAARVVQGIGGSMLSPVGLAIVVNTITDPRERARAIGVWASVFGLSMAIGPALGGALTAGLGWRSVFWINVPVVAVALALAAAFVPESRAGQPRRLDGPGQVLLTAVVGGSVAVLIEGPRIGWGSTAALAGYACVTAATAGFVWTEARRREPLMDLHLFRRPPFAAAVAGAVVVFAALNATLLLGTLYLQHARGMSAAEAGAVTLPMGIAATVCAPLSGILVSRTGPRLPLLLAGSLTAAGGLCLVFLGNHTSLRLLLLAYFLIGVGVGFANAPITNTAVSGLPAARAGVAGAITSTARQFGAALGIAVAGSIVAGASDTALAHASRPGWIMVAACGLLVLVIAQASPAPAKVTRATAKREALQHARDSSPGGPDLEEPLVPLYRAEARAGSGFTDDGEVPGDGRLMIGVRLSDPVSPLRNGRPLGEGDRSALVIGGTEKIRTGEVTVFLQVVAVAPARVRRDGRVQAQGSPCDHATLRPLEEWLEAQAGPGVIDGIAHRAVLRKEYVKGERERLLARAFMIRAIVLVPDADVREAVIALAGDLALVPWARAWVPASARACGDWRNALGPEPLEELQDIVLRASHAEHEDRGWRAVIIGPSGQLKTGSLDGTLLRVPDTPANRAMFGSVGTGDDSSPFPQVRALPLSDFSTRALLGMPGLLTKDPTDMA